MDTHIVCGSVTAARENKETNGVERKKFLGWKLKGTSEKAICLLFYCCLHSTSLIFIDFGIIFLFFFSLFSSFGEILLPFKPEEREEYQKCLCKLILFERAGALNEFSFSCSGGRFRVSLCFFAFIVSQKFSFTSITFSLFMLYTRSFMV